MASKGVPPYYENAVIRRVPMSDDKRPDELAEGDMLLMQICAPVLNHAE